MSCASFESDEEKSEFLVRYDRFIEWLSKRGFIPFRHLRVTDFPGTGRGVMCTRDIAVGETIVSIPKSLLVSTDTVINCSALGPHIKSFGGPRLSPLCALSAFLMCERLTGRNSPWGPYLDVLPTTYTTPPFLPTGHIGLFQPYVQKRIRVAKERLKWEYERVRPFLCYISRFYGPGVTSFHLFRWAWFTVNTRAVYLPNSRKCPALSAEVDSCALAPFLDFLNHSTQVRVKAGFVEGTGTYDVTTLDSVSTGDQVFISYGSHDNLTLLLDYGFVLTKNPNSCVEFHSSEVLDSFERVLGTSLRHAAETNGAHLVSCARDLSCTWDGPSWNLLELLKRFLSQTMSDKDDEGKDVVAETLVSDLMTKRLETATDLKGRLNRRRHRAASEMSSVLIDEEIDILTRHLAKRH